MKRLLALIITTVLLFLCVYLVALLGVWLAWYSAQTAMLAAVGVSIGSLLLFFVRGRIERRKQRK